MYMNIYIIYTYVYMYILLTLALQMAGHDASGWRSSIAARGTPGQVQTKPVSSPGEEKGRQRRGTPGQGAYGLTPSPE